MEDIGGMLASSTVRSRMLEAVREKATGGIPVDGVVLEGISIMHDVTMWESAKVASKEGVVLRAWAIFTHTKLIGTPNTL